MKSLILFLTLIVLAPLFSAIILKIKAFAAGKKGIPLLINYYTLIKLVQKTSVYSMSTSEIFQVGYIITLATTLTSLLFLPFSGLPPLLSFKGDIILVLYLMSLGKFFTIISAMDTGSSFEGLGASREAFFSFLAESAFFMVIISFFWFDEKLSIASYFMASNKINVWNNYNFPLPLVGISLFLILLTENSRVPVDDPATHLELTMIHEVMILDHSGPALAFIYINSYLKLLFFSSFLTLLLFPKFDPNNKWNIASFYITLICIYISIGITESIMARFKLNKVPKFLVITFSLATFATIIIMGFTR
mgnify:CR=1 FL=1